MKNYHVYFRHPVLADWQFNATYQSATEAWDAQLCIRERGSIAKVVMVKPREGEKVEVSHG